MSESFPTVTQSWAMETDVSGQVTPGDASLNYDTPGLSHLHHLTHRERRKNTCLTIVLLLLEDRDSYKIKKSWWLRIRRKIQTKNQGSGVFFECFKTRKTKLCLLRIPQCHICSGRGQSRDKIQIPERGTKIFTFLRPRTLLSPGPSPVPCLAWAADAKEIFCFHQTAFFCHWLKSCPWEIISGLAQSFLK